MCNRKVRQQSENTNEKMRIYLVDNNFVACLFVIAIFKKDFDSVSYFRYNIFKKIFLMKASNEKLVQTTSRYNFFRIIKCRKKA